MTKGFHSDDPFGAFGVKLIKLINKLGSTKKTSPKFILSFFGLIAEEKLHSIKLHSN